MREMKDYVEWFPAQLREAVAIAEKAVIRSCPVENVLICGLGGSGIGGTLATETLAREISVPYGLSKGYFIPGWVSEKTLCIVSSYSGNTEETLQAMHSAMEKGAKIVCITSGGKVAEIAREKGLDLIIVPSGHPPRTCLGYSLVQLLNIFHVFGLVKENLLGQVLESADHLKSEKDAIQKHAREIANRIGNKMPVLYSTTFHEGLAIRWRQQINENAKMLCWHNVVPEMNHNELVGWKGDYSQLHVLFLLFSDEYDRNLTRIKINKDVISGCGASMEDVSYTGANRVVELMHLIHIGDWLSVYLSDTRQVDPVEVRVIDHLKSELGKS